MIMVSIGKYDEDVEVRRYDSKSVTPLRPTHHGRLPNPVFDPVALVQTFYTSPPSACKIAARKKEPS